MPELDDDDKTAWGALGELMDRVRARLQPGGPPVDQEQLFDLICGELSDEQIRVVTQRVRTWKSWHEEYWKLRAYMDLAGDVASDNDVGSAETAEASRAAIPAQAIANHVGDPRTDLARRSRSWLTVTIASVAIIGIAVFVSRISPRSTSLVVSIDDPLGKVARNTTGIHGLEAFPQEWRSDITVMLETGRVQASNIALNFRRGTRGNDSPDTAYIQPKGTVVRTTTPQFLWKPLGEGVTYEVVIFAINDERPPVSSGVLTETSWTVPELTPLSQGVVYEWEVVVRGEGPEHVPDELHRPRFKVIAIDALAAIQEAEKAARGSHLVLTAAYLDAGLLDEAHRELDKLAAENPKSPIVGDWLKSLELQR